MNMKVELCCFWVLFFPSYQLLCVVGWLQVPGIPLATGKQQDCLLYLVTIATGLKWEAVMEPLCCAGKAGWAAQTPYVAAGVGMGWGLVLFGCCTDNFPLLGEALLWNSIFLRMSFSFGWWMTSQHSQ